MRFIGALLLVDLQVVDGLVELLGGQERLARCASRSAAMRSGTSW